MCIDYNPQNKMPEALIKIKIPAGIDQGQRIRYSNKGEAGSFGTSSGDLYIIFRVKLHPRFKRQNFNILSEIFK